MNKVILMGRLTRDPDIRSSAGEESMLIARYTLAVDRRTKQNNNEQTADFISCVAFGKGAEFAEKYLHQGIKVLVTGRIQTGSYTSRDGHKVYTTDVLVDEQEFCESKNTGNSSGNNAGRSYGSAAAGQEAGQAGAQYESRQPAGPDDGFMNLPMGVEDEGLPFT